MHTVFHGEIKFYQFDIFPETEVIQAIFTRQGGVSPFPWKSLNQGGTTGDNRSRVIENRRLAFESVNLDVETVFDVWQVHGTTIIESKKPRDLEQPHEKADAIVSNQSGITLFMRFADCVPILLFEPQNRVIAIVHAGWQGTVKRVAEIAVEYLTHHYRCDSRNILAGIGPSICPDHYIVRQDVIVRVKNAFPLAWPSLIKNAGEKFNLNLWEANKICLQEAGVQNIEISGICTACNLEEWYSHRAEHGRTGRFGVLFALR